MKRYVLCLLAAASTLTFAASAIAASDYLLEIDGVDGGAASSIEVQSWSWGTSNSGVMTTQSGSAARLRESPSRASIGRTARVGDPIPDIDLASIVSLNEIQAFSLDLGKASPVLARLCAGQHIAHATLHAGADTFELANAAVSGCRVSGDPHIYGGRSTMPNRISMNVTVPKQTQGATFGERCAAGGVCADGSVTLTITGQMRHTKSGHVTLLK